MGFGWECCIMQIAASWIFAAPTNRMRQKVKSRPRSNYEKSKVFCFHDTKTNWHSQFAEGI
jgi:hypothetical protein